MAQIDQADNSFAFVHISNPLASADPATRTLVRRHVMKDIGKTRRKEDSRKRRRAIKIPVHIKPYILQMQQAESEDFGASPHMIRGISPPTTLMVTELMFYEVRKHVRSRIELRIGPNGERRRLPASTVLIEFNQAVTNGINTLGTCNTSTGMASLEQGFRYLKPFLLDEHFSTCLEIADLLISTKIQGRPEVARMLLQQICSLATALFGPSHSLAIWTRCYLDLFEFEPDALALRKATTDVLEEVLGPDDPYSVTAKICEAESNFKMQVHDYERDEIMKMYSKLEYACHTFKDADEKLRHSIFLQPSFARKLVEIGEYQQAEKILSQSPAHLEWYIQHKDQSLSCVTNALNSVSLLATALSGQGYHVKARELWVRAIEVGADEFGHSSPVTLNVMFDYLKHLTALQEYETAAIIQGLIDKNLEPFMLKDEADYFKDSY